ncbi:MAG: transglycosylase SLT domain-containing protein [Aquiluna sp.]
MAKHAKVSGGRGRGLFVLGYFFVASLVMVSAVDPYSGTIASANSVDTYDQPMVAYQSLQLVPLSGLEYSRGSFEVLTGEEARPITVRRAPTPEPGSVKAFALAQVESKGWDYDQFSCLVKLWERESNWRWNATNKSSGAYGIPQSLPATKMAKAGADWRTNPETQVRWGIGYIDGRYGSPCAALVHSDEHNWY